MSSFDDGRQGPAEGFGEEQAAGLGEPPAPAEEPQEPVDSLDRLDRRVVTYWILAGLMTSVFPIGLLVGGAWWATSRWDEITVWVIPLAVSLGSLYLLYAIIYPPLAYARWRYKVDHELLVARYGVIFHEEKFIPISRLQHVDLHRGPVERMFGLATLVVFTAGTEGAHFGVPGLAVTRAQELRDKILQARGDDVI